MPLIQLSGLSRHYGEDETLVKALDNISLSIDEGEIVALLGTRDDSRRLVSIAF